MLESQESETHPLEIREFLTLQISMLILIETSQNEFSMNGLIVIKRDEEMQQSH